MNNSKIKRKLTKKTCKITSLSFWKQEKQKHDRKVQVKWPNDIYYGSEKIGGVLVEFTPGDDCYHAAVGMFLIASFSTRKLN